MDALDVVLIGLVAILATALALMLLARLRDLRAIPEERSKREWLEEELHAARARIDLLELGQLEDRREPVTAGRFSRR